MALATWWRGHDAPPPSSHQPVPVEVTSDVPMLSSLVGVSEQDIQQRLADGHRPYIARVEGQPASYGWVATRTAQIGELDLRIDLPDGDSYLWDFGTLPQFRGRGLYPAVLQAILDREPTERFWIIFAPENLPSGVGIQRAGFTPVAELSFDSSGKPALHLNGPAERVEAARRLLALDPAVEPLASCWRCTTSGSMCSCDCSSRRGEDCCCAIRPDRSAAR